MNSAITVAVRRQANIFSLAVPLYLLTLDVRALDGTIFHFSERIGKFVPVICGPCGKRRMSRIPSLKAREKWTGHCRSCRLRKFFSDSLLKGGGTLERKGQLAGKAWRVCGQCGKREFISIQYRTSWSGNCFDCAHRKRTGKWKHPSSGAEVLFDDRDPKYHQKIAFRCAKSSCHEKDYVWAQSIEKKDWSGLCTACRHDRGHPGKITLDLLLEPYKSIIHFSERTNTQVPVTCGVCKYKRIASLQSILSSYQSSGWTGYCKGRCNPEALRLLLEKKEYPKRRRKPPVKQTSKPLVVLGKTIDDLNAAIRKLHNDLGLNSLVTVPKVAFELSLGRLKHGDEGAENIRRLLRKNNVRESFPQYRDKIIASG